MLGVKHPIFPNDLPITTPVNASGYGSKLCSPEVHPKLLGLWMFIPQKLWDIPYISVNIQLIAISRSAKWAGKLWAGPKSDASAPFFPAKTGHKRPPSHPTRSRVTRAGHSFPSQLGREGSALQCPVLCPLVSFEWLKTTRNSGKTLFLLKKLTSKVVGFVFLNGLTV